MTRLLFVYGLAIFASCLTVAQAQDDWTFREPELSETQHQIDMNGESLSYIARVGLIPIRANETGEVLGHFGFVSYTLNRAAGQRTCVKCH